MRILFLNDGKEIQSDCWTALLVFCFLFAITYNPTSLRNICLQQQGLPPPSLDTEHALASYKTTKRTTTLTLFGRAAIRRPSSNTLSTADDVLFPVGRRRCRRFKFQKPITDGK